MNNPSSTNRKDTRYVQGGTTTIKKKTVGWWERNPDFTKRADDDIVIKSLPAVYNGRPDLLSYDIYGNNNLEWVILQYNNIVDINEEFVTGVDLVLPSINRLFSSMLIKSIGFEADDV